MKKITENALLYRVNQLNEKMAFYEAVGDGSQTPVGGLPSQTPNRQTPGNPGYNVKPAPAEKAPATPTATQTQAAPVAPAATQTQATPTATQTQAAPATPSATDYLGNAWDSLKTGAKYAWDHPGEVVGGMANALSSDLTGAKNIANSAIQGWNAGQGGTQGQQKVGANQGAQTGGKWPTTDPEIRAFQKANGLKADGLIGANTMAALQKQGVQPPAGFKPVASKQHLAQQGTAAKPTAGATPVAGQVMPNGSVSSGDAERDERMAQASQVMNMTPDQRHAFDMAAGQKDYAATHPAAPAANKAPVAGQVQSTGDPVKDSELAKQGNAVVYKEDQDLARIVQLVNW